MWVALYRLLQTQKAAELLIRPALHNVLVNANLIEPGLILMDLKGIMGSMTWRLLEKEVLELPARSRVRLVEKIIESIDDYADPGLAAAWDQEIERRVKEIKSGADEGIPAAQVMENARRALNETRRLPSARRK